jgi:high affinity Mn2+ porin
MGSTGRIEKVLTNRFDPFKGTVSYTMGLSAGYNFMLPSSWVFGVESDVSLPNTISGSVPCLQGPWTFRETVLTSGTVRGRVGYAPGSWLFDVTSGFA